MPIQSFAHVNMPGKPIPPHLRASRQEMRKSELQTSYLIIRLSAIGDVVMASPVAETIKRQRPNAKIYWLTQPEYLSLIRDNPFVDDVICWDKQNWQALLAKGNLFALTGELRKLRSALHAYDFEYALDLQGLFKSGFLAWLSGAKTRVGLGSKEGSGRFMTRTISRNLGDRAHIGSEYRYLVNQLGYQEAGWQMRVPVSQEIISESLELLPQDLRTNNYAVVCPFSTQPQKRWVDDNWRQVILRLRGRYHLRTVILGGPKDIEHGNNLAKGSGAINLAGKTRLLEAGALIKNASLLIGLDSGLTHMGHAFKIPTVGLFGATCPYSHTGLETSSIIYLDRYCSPCRRKPTCGGKFECMADIKPERVLTEIKSLMRYFYENEKR